MSNKNKPAYNVTEILREQYQLVKTEREIDALLKKVNDQINQLLVEELHLKSSLISQTTDSKSPRESPQPTTSQAATNFDAVNIINEQNLNLNAIINSNFDNQEEEEEEEEDD